MKKLKLKPIIIATATGAALTCSSVVSASSFVNFMTEPGVDANAVLAAKFGTILSFNKHMLCSALITDTETALEGKGYYQEADKQGSYFPSSTATVSSSAVTIGSKATEFQDKWHANIIDWTFDKDKMTACATESTFLCSAEEAGSLDTKTRYNDATGNQRTENGVNQIRCVLTLGTGCSPSLADNGVVILDLVDVDNGNTPSACAHTVSIPGLEFDSGAAGIDSDDIEAARVEADAVKSLIENLFQKASDSIAPNMIRAHVTNSARDIGDVSTGSDHGY